MRRTNPRLEVFDGLRPCSQTVLEEIQGAFAPVDEERRVQIEDLVEFMIEVWVFGGDPAIKPIADEILDPMVRIRWIP